VERSGSRRRAAQGRGRHAADIIKDLQTALDEISLISADLAQAE
jgi:hypothetical protein